MILERERNMGVREKQPPASSCMCPRPFRVQVDAPTIEDPRPGPASTWSVLPLLQGVSGTVHRVVETALPSWSIQSSHILFPIPLRTPDLRSLLGVPTKNRMELRPFPQDQVQSSNLTAAQLWALPTQLPSPKTLAA